MRAGIRVLLRQACIVAVGFSASVSAAQDAGLGTPEDQKNLIAGICTMQLDIGPAGCGCLAERSLTGLDETQRAYLILSVVQPPAAERLPIAQSKEELATIFRFLETARAGCLATAPTGPDAGTTAEPAETPAAPQ